MKKFQVFRYLSEWKYVILLVVLIGSIMIYWYGVSNQTYTATAVFEYTNPEAANGNNPDLSPIDASEIISAAVITDSIKDLGIGTNVESIRSKCSIKEIVPAAEEEKKAAALKLGNDYTYSPTNYQISFTVGSSYSKDYARDVLDAILTNYFAIYCQKYIDYAVFPNNASNISTEKYDYIDCVEMLETTADEIIYYLDLKAQSYPDFRSAITGYSFDDLVDAYKNIKDSVLTQTHAFILNNKLVINRDLLIKRYENYCAQYEIEIKNYDAHINEAKQLIDDFGSKTLEENEKDYSFGGSKSINDGLIIGNVEDGMRGNRAEVETTYDTLINQYVDLQSRRIALRTKLRKCLEVLDVYSASGISNDTESPNAKDAVERISSVTEQLNSLYAKIIPTIDEFNRKNGADNLAMKSSIVVRESINLKIYIALAVVFFLFAGGCLAVLLGRVGDFIMYFMYTDKKTGLPNRNRCDMVIDSYDGKLLPEGFTCLVFRILLQSSNPEFGRKEGDELLQSFGKIAGKILQETEFVGYNDNGVFIVFADDCSLERALVLEERVNDAVDSYNALVKYPINLSSAVANSSKEKIYALRDLLRFTVRKTMSLPSQASSANKN